MSTFQSYFSKRKKLVLTVRAASAVRDPSVRGRVSGRGPLGPWWFPLAAGVRGIFRPGSSASAAPRDRLAVRAVLGGHAGPGSGRGRRAGGPSRRAPLCPRPLLPGASGIRARGHRPALGRGGGGSRGARGASICWESVKQCQEGSSSKCPKVRAQIQALTPPTPSTVSGKRSITHYVNLKWLPLDLTVN